MTYSVNFEGSPYEKQQISRPAFVHDSFFGSVGAILVDTHQLPWDTGISHHKHAPHPTTQANLL